MTLALSQLFHVFKARSAEPVLFGRRLLENRWVWGAVALTLGLQLAVVYHPGPSRLFLTEPLAAGEWLVVLGASLVPLLAGQLYKIARQRRPSSGGSRPRPRRGPRRAPAGSAAAPSAARRSRRRTRPPGRGRPGARRAARRAR